MDEVADIESGIIKLIAGVLSPDTLAFFGGLGVWGWVGIGAVLLLVGVGSYFLLKWAKDKAIEKAAKKTEENRSQAETKLPSHQSKLEQGARASLSKLKKWLSDLKKHSK